MSSDLVSSDVVPSPSKKAQHEYPCLGCGASVVFDVDSQSLKCEYCGFTKAIDKEFSGQSENSYEEYLKKPKHQNPGSKPLGNLKTMSCGECGASLSAAVDQIGLSCPYCTTPLHESLANDGEDRIAIDGILPFKVSRDWAQANLKKWVKGLWFAPNDFQRRGVQGKFNGVYSPFFTFDSHTTTHYHGQRGDNYTVTVGSGKNRRQEIRTRWFPVSGIVREFFDDVLICATTDLSQNLVKKLEPWPLHDLREYSGDYLPGFSVRTYSTSLSESFSYAKARMKEAIHQLVCMDIGGDHQRISQMNISHDAVSYKHLLLPLWILSYRYQDKVYQVAVNATTGEVSGQRPWSWVKISFTVVFTLIFIGLSIYLWNHPSVQEFLGRFR